MRFYHLLMLFCSLLLVNSAMGQTYQIIKIAGLITNCESGDTLRIADKIASEEQLCFWNSSTRFSAAALIDPATARRYLLKANDPSSGIQRNAVYEGLIRSLGGFSNRGSIRIDSLFSFALLFGEKDFLIIGDTLTLTINTRKVPLDEKNFIYAAYEYEGEQVNKRLRVKEDSLYLTASEIYTVDGLPIKPGQTRKFRLFYLHHDQNKRKNTLLVSFNPTFVGKEELMPELDIIYTVIQEKNRRELEQDRQRRREALRGELAAYLEELYGKTSGEVLEQWLDQYLQGKEQKLKEHD